MDLSKIYRTVGPVCGLVNVVLEIRPPGPWSQKISKTPLRSLALNEISDVEEFITVKVLESMYNLGGPSMF